MSKALARIKNWCELGEQANWSASRLAQITGVSRRTLERHFLLEMRMPPKTWLNVNRQRLAVGFLQNGSSVKEAAHRLGYQQTAQFSKMFLQTQGIRPQSLKSRHVY